MSAREMFILGPVMLLEALLVVSQLCVTRTVLEI